MAKLDDEGWSITEVSGSAKVLVVDDWLFMVCSETLSFRKRLFRNSQFRNRLFGNEIYVGG